MTLIKKRCSLKVMVNWNFLYKSQHLGLTTITFCITNNMDICGPNWTKNSSIYSGSLLKQSPPPSQYIPSVYSSRNYYGQSKKTTTETPKEPEKHQHMSEDEQKQFVLQKKWKLYTDSFQLQEHGVECVQGECLRSHLGQQE